MHMQITVRMLYVCICQHLCLLQAVDPGTGDMVYDCFTDGESRAELETRLTHLQPVELLLSTSPTPATRSLLYGLAALR